MLKKVANAAVDTAVKYGKSPLSKSRFKEEGKLTPEEFVLAGDYLVSACPTWAWEAGDASKAQAFLPPGKQYLITRNVPCFSRASAVEDYSNVVMADPEEVEGDGEGGGWIEADAAAAGVTAEGFEELPSVARTEVVQVLGDEEDVAAQGGGAGDEDAEIPDISNLDLEDDDAAAAPPPPPAPATVAEGANAGVVRPRTYDLLISYNLRHDVPRFWLVGYGEDRTPLSQTEVMQDVISDYYNYRDRDTVTVEAHPHRAEGGRVVSIHPCRHAAVMKKLAGLVAGEGKDFSVEQYMILFLKFLSSVVPTIEYDYSFSAGS